MASAIEARRIRIVALDAYTLNPGDLCWDDLHQLGDTAIYDRTPPEEVIARSRGAEVLLTNKVELKRHELDALEGLRYIGILATGTNVVDLAAAGRRGICVTNVPDYGTASVAQTTFALLLELTQNAGHHSQTVHEGKWSQAKDWCYWDKPLVELAVLTLGVVGFGRIGRAVAELGRAFGMNLLVHTPHPDRQQNSIEFSDLDTLLRRSDVVSLHCPLTPATQHLMNTERLALMKPGALLLNTSRGGLLDEQAVADALNSGRLAGAGLDVLSMEPPPSDNPLLSAKNCVITPHLAWATRSARSRLMNIAIQNVRSFLAGKPQNVVRS